MGHRDDIDYLHEGDAHHAHHGHYDECPSVSLYLPESTHTSMPRAAARPGPSTAIMSTYRTAPRGRLDSGMAWINQPTSTEAGLPFGGVKRSGFDRELSQLGIYGFTNRKLVRTLPPDDSG